MKLSPLILLMAIMLLGVPNKCTSQIFKKYINVIKDKLTDKGTQVVNKGTDAILDGNNPTTNSGNGTATKTVAKNSRPLLSELHDEDFIQHPSTAFNLTDTRFPIAKNLAIGLKGNYPKGYSPKWRFVSYPSEVNIAIENWLFPNANVRHENYPFSIVAYNNKAVLRLNTFIGCECFADIVVKDTMAVIDNTPQTFQITNFRKILNERSTGEPCIPMSGNSNYAGGLEGRLTLSANDNGDLLMDFMLENYSAETKDYAGRPRPSQVASRYIAKGTTIENEMSPEKANGIVAEEKAAKQRQKDYEAKTKKQLDSVMKVIARKYPQAECRECFVRNSDHSLSVTPTKTAYTNGYGDVYVESGTDWDINTKTNIKNKCNHDLIFVGIQQLRDEEGGYYLAAVTKTMLAGYTYSSEQGIMSSLFTSFLGGGSEYNIAIQDKYYTGNASVGGVQWLKIVKK
jgi:hypothetical protein